MKHGKPRHSEVEQQNESWWSTGHRYLTSGVLQLPQKMVQAVDLYYKEGKLTRQSAAGARSVTDKQVERSPVPVLASVT